MSPAGGNGPLMTFPRWNLPNIPSDSNINSSQSLNRSRRTQVNLCFLFFFLIEIILKQNVTKYLIQLRDIFYSIDFQIERISRG